MRPGLKNGKLLAPGSLAAALKRQRQLEAEMQRIEQQMRDGERRLRYAGDVEYHVWKNKAESARSLFNCELKQLRQWVTDQERALLKRTRDMLRELEKDGVEFELQEVELIEELDEHLNALGV